LTSALERNIVGPSKVFQADEGLTFVKLTFPLFLRQKSYGKDGILALISPSPTSPKEDLS